MTFEDFERRLQGIGTQLDDTTNRALAIAGNLVAQIKANAPADTGSLRNSIGVGIESGGPRAIYFAMLDYGFFQNYGVGASPDSKTAKNNRQAPVEGPVYGSLPPRNGNFYRFGVKKSDKKPWGAFYSGLNAIGFFSMAEIERRLVEGLQEDINNNI